MCFMTDYNATSVRVYAPSCCRGPSRSWPSGPSRAATDSNQHQPRLGRIGRRLTSVEAFEFEENASPTFCDVDFWLCGCIDDAAESDLPLNMSPMCSVVDFSESG